MTCFPFAAECQQMGLDWNLGFIWNKNTPQIVEKWCHSNAWKTQMHLSQQSFWTIPHPKARAGKDVGGLYLRSRTRAWSTSAWTSRPGDPLSPDGGSQSAATPRSPSPPAPDPSRRWRYPVGVAEQVFIVCIVCQNWALEKRIIKRLESILITMCMSELFQTKFPWLAKEQLLRSVWKMFSAHHNLFLLSCDPAFNPFHLSPHWSAVV